MEDLVTGAQSAKAPMKKGLTAHIIPRNAVRGETWSKMVAELNV